MSVFRIINTAEELLEASQDKTARYLIIRNDLTNVPCIRLLPFQIVFGEFDGKEIKFASSSEGFCLSKGNEIKNLKITVDPDKRAIFQDNNVESMSTHHLSRLNVTGQISFIIKENIKKGRIDASFIHIENATTLHLTERPNKYGVDMVQGAFTIWNQREDMSIVIDVDITHFSCGSETKAISGTGLLICGFEEKLGSIRAGLISCGHIYTKGEIGIGVSNIVSAGIAIGYEVVVKNLSNYGRITCYGGNEMGIYNWGVVEKWSITDRIETHGPNGCGFINAGDLGKVSFTHEIETFGVGARGFYMFDGVLKEIHFERIVTHGDAACAIQFNKFISRLSVSNGIETFGNAIDVVFADTLSKVGADALSIKAGGVAGMIKITGDLITNGKDARTIFDGTSIEKLYVSGAVIARGENSLALEISNAYFSSDNVTFSSENWAAVKLVNAKINNSHNLTAKGKNVDIIIDILSSIEKQIVSNESLKGVFQDNVRIDYTDNVMMDNVKDNQNQKSDSTNNNDSQEISKNESSPEVEKTDPVSKSEIESLNPADSSEKPHPMACKAPSNKFEEKPDDNKESKK